jgi:hypothetical protein
MTLSQAAELVAYSAFSFHGEPQADAKTANDACGLPLKRSKQYATARLRSTSHQCKQADSKFERPVVIRCIQESCDGESLIP